jgi:hypothetical protein
MWYNGSGLTMHVSFMVKCVNYMGLLFMDGAALKGCHYRTDIINSVGHLRSNLVVPLVLYMVACNGWGINIVLQVPCSAKYYLN